MDHLEIHIEKLEIRKYKVWNGIIRFELEKNSIISKEGAKTGGPGKYLRGYNKGQGNMVTTWIKTVTNVEEAKAQ